MLGTDAGLVYGLLFDGAGGARRQSWSDVAAWTPERGTLWLHLDHADAEARAWLAGAGLDDVVRGALLDPDPRPRALAVGDALLVILRAINVDEGAEPEDMVSLRCWIEPRRIVTLRHRLVRAVRAIADDLEAARGPTDAAALAVALVERSLEPVVACVDGIDDAVARAEDEVLAAAAPHLRARIGGLRRRAIALRRFIAPQRDALARLSTAGVSWLDDAARARLREAADRLTRTVEELDAARDRAAVTHEELSSRVGEVTNQRLYVLSILSAIFLPLGFLADLFGVSVGGVPGHDAAWGFWALALAFAGIGIFMLWLFRRWKWL